MYEKSEIREWLNNSILKVTFHKVNGETRVMRCTLLKDYIPEFKQSTQSLTEDKYPDKIAVWDLEKQAWRSFLIPNIIGVTECIG